MPGTETHNMIPLSIPNLSELEQESVRKVLESGWISSAGPEVYAFENEMARYCNAGHAVATVNGTAALHLSLLLAGVERGDWVIGPNLCFVAPMNALRYLGAEPVLVDSDPVTWQMDPVLVEQFLETECVLREKGCFHRESGIRVRAMLVVHILGNMAAVDRLRELASRYRLALVEDAAEALGASKGEVQAGNWGQFGCLSFNGNKILSTGGGGMILTDDQAMAAEARRLSAQARSHAREYLHDVTGYNYRMPNLNAALGLAQLKRMPEFLQRKRTIRGFYDYYLGELEQVRLFPKAGEEEIPNNWLYTIRCSESRQLEAFLGSRDIETRKLWVPLNRLGMFRRSPYIQESDHAHRIYEQSLSLPCSTGISDGDLEQVAGAIQEFFESVH